MSTEEQRKAAEKLIQFTEQQVSAEITDLRRRRDEVLHYISQIDNPNPQTLWHIRNILTGDDKIYTVMPTNETEYVLTTEAAAKPWCVTAQGKVGHFKNRICLVSGHNTEEEAAWAADRLWAVFGISAEAGRQ